MNKKRFTTEQIIHKLRLAEVEISKGKRIPEVSRQIGDARAEARHTPVSDPSIFAGGGLKLP